MKAIRIIFGFAGLVTASVWLWSSDCMPGFQKGYIQLLIIAAFILSVKVHLEK